MEAFLTAFEGAISFLYLVPYTQAQVYEETDKQADADEVESASLAIKGVLEAYSRKRNGFSSIDQHFMLVTKWDAYVDTVPSGQASDSFGDRQAIEQFVKRRYSQAYSRFRSLISPERASLNAYCAGKMDQHGLRPAGPEEEKDAVAAFPRKLWKWIYSNALVAADGERASPFPDPPAVSPIVRAWRGLLDAISGR